MGINVAGEKILAELFVELGDDDNLWLTSLTSGTAVAVVKKENGGFFVAEGDAFHDQVGPFPTMEALIGHVEENRLFAPWGSPGV